MKAVFPGSFDPFTQGHLDLLTRAAKMFDEVVVGVLINPNKQATFTMEERISQIKNATQNIPNVKAVAFSGFLVDLLHQEETHIVVRGLRGDDEVAYENNLAKAYQEMDPQVEVVYLLAKDEYKNISSTLVRQGLLRGTDVGSFVPFENYELVKKQWEAKNVH